MLLSFLRPSRKRVTVAARLPWMTVPRDDAPLTSILEKRGEPVWREHCTMARIGLFRVFVLLPHQVGTDKQYWIYQ